MDFLQKINPSLPLRLGLGTMYVYSGYDLFVHPAAWTWAIPGWFSRLVTSVMPIETYLKIQGISELLFAFLFLAWFIPKMGVRIAAFISSLEFLFILLFTSHSQFLITFRDLGLLGASITLFLMTFQNHGSTKQA